MRVLLDFWCCLSLILLTTPFALLTLVVVRRKSCVWLASNGFIRGPFLMEGAGALIGALSPQCSVVGSPCFFLLWQVYILLDLAIPTSVMRWA